MWLILVLVLFILAYLYATRNFAYWRQRDIPFEKPVPFLGNVPLVLFKKSIGDYLKDLYEKSSGPVYGFFILHKPCLLIRDPEIIKHVLVKDFHVFFNRAVTMNKEADPIGSRTLFVIQNSEWQQSRQKMSTAFSSKKLRLMFPLMTEVGNDMIKYVEKFNGEPLEGKPLALKFSTDVIASCAFGVKGFSFEKENSEFHYATTKLLHFDWFRGLQVVCYFLSPFMVNLFRMKFLHPQSTQFLKKLFWDVFNSKKKSGVQRYDLIDSLIEIRETDKDLTFALDDDLTVAQAISFIAGGYESSGSVSFLAFYELALHSDIQKRLPQEILDVCEQSGGLTYDAIKKMTYLDMVLKEVLRKYPILPFLDRLAKSDFKIPNTDIVIEKGTAVYIPVLGVQRNPQYFPNPKKFDPERFAPENVANIPKILYLPFGEGPRKCVGEMFGKISSKLSVIFMISEFEILPTDNTPLELRFDPRAFVLHPLEKVHLRFKKINSSLSFNFSKM